MLIRLASNPTIGGKEKKQGRRSKGEEAREKKQGRRSKGEEEEEEEEAREARQEKSARCVSLDFLCLRYGPLLKTEKSL
jgi:hypothetical protein